MPAAASPAAQSTVPAHQHPRAKVAQGTAAPQLYQGRHPEQSLLYRTIAAHFETWLALASSGQFDGQGDLHTPPAYVEQAFRKYLECGIFAHGFARARCADCGHDFLVAFSCKGRGVCPSCTTRRMAETAAHLTDHIFPRLPVRQWVLSVPKHLRYFLQNDPKALNTALRIFLRVIHSNLHQHCASATGIDKRDVHSGACAFIHRFGSSLNTHVHFHICVIDGVFEAGAASGDDKGGNTGAIFHAASHLDAAAIANVQSEVKRRIVRAFVKRGLLDAIAGEVMIDARQGGGFSVDASVCIGSDDRAGLERLLRYCARPPFAMERLHPKGKDKLLYHCPKPQPGGKQGDLVLTPLELIDKIAVLVPPPRTHRHRYFGVLAPNSPLRAAVTALASHPEAVPLSPADREIQADAPETAKRSLARYLWAVLIARLYAVFPLLCLHCGGEMHLIGFVNEGAEIKKILDYIGEPSTPPKISQARSQPLWDAGEAAQIEVFNAGLDYRAADRPWCTVL